MGVWRYMSNYQYIDPLDPKPAMSRKPCSAKSMAQLFVEQFINDGIRYAVINRDVADDFKTPTTCARGFDRVIKTLGHSGNVKGYSYSENVYPELIG